VRLGEDEEPELLAARVRDRERSTFDGSSSKNSRRLWEPESAFGLIAVAAGLRVSERHRLCRLAAELAL
jgi:hypothetical protein